MDGLALGVQQPPTGNNQHLDAESAQGMRSFQARTLGERSS